MINAILVGAGGFFGAVCRYLLGNLSLKLWGANYPYGTLIVNVCGSLCIGFMSAWLLTVPDPRASRLRLIAITGFLGGFTTWSSFALDYTNMCRETQYWQAAGYIGLHLLLSFAAVFAGFWAARRLC